MIFVATFLFGVSIDVQETVLRVVVADRIHLSKRGTAYGIFNTVYGAGFLIGGVLVGWLYDNVQGMAPVAPVIISVMGVSIFLS